MKVRIRDAFATITPQMLSKVKNGFEKRICKCLEMEGGHFEHLFWYFSLLILIYVLIQEDLVHCVKAELSTFLNTIGN